MDRPSFIKHCEQLRTDQTFCYPGDNETFGTGASLGRAFGLKRVAINYEVLEPGDRSSWPHAHSKAEEFIFILEGYPSVWINGHLHDLNPGDSVGLPAGTGLAHCLINNSDETVRVLVVGECESPDDKIIYPKHPKRNQEMKDKGAYWEDHPILEMGAHDGCSDIKRS